MALHFQTQPHQDYFHAKVDFMISGPELSDFPCDGKFPCGNCKLPDDKPLYLKGICADVIETTYDNQYYVYGIKHDKPYFR